MAGGAEVQIKGQGFDMQPPLNQIVMQGSGVLANIGKVIAPALDGKYLLKVMPLYRSIPAAIAVFGMLNWPIIKRIKT
jgi:hypothetical protein